MVFFFKLKLKNSSLKSIKFFSPFNFFYNNKKFLFVITMRYVKFGASLISLPFISAFGATYYYFPELRQNKSQLFKAFTRMVRVAARGGQMAAIYFLVFFHKMIFNWFFHCIFRKMIPLSKNTIKQHVFSRTPS